jgi:voltage-gated potassium channel
VQRHDYAIELPGTSRGPLYVLLQRLAGAVFLTLLVTLVAWLGRSGYRDAAGGEPGFFDMLYYSTVSITTTGYGDITPISDEARLATTFIITPARILFLILLVGTTVELLAERSRAAIKQRYWRRRLNEHVIVAGYGTKGRAAVEALIGKGTPANQIVVIDPDPAAREAATDDGLAAIPGDASTSAVLRAAEIDSARAVVIATDRDDTSVLATLTARELNPSVRISAAVREEENAHLLRQGGADSVITSSASAGRLLGLACEAPGSVAVIEDLLKIGVGLDIEERTVGSDDTGPAHEVLGHNRLVGVVRDGSVLHFDDEAAQVLEAGDRVLYLKSHEKPA